MDETSNVSVWASRRKGIYLGFIVFFLTAASFFIFSKFWYTAPTCFDKVQNGDEQGIDCGGSCAKICSAGLIRPIVRWDPRLFEVLPGVWSSLVYVENPNVGTSAVYVPYTLTIFDEKNNVLAKREGATVLPNKKVVGVFEGSISITDGYPRRALFEIGDQISWKKVDKNNEEEITITHSPLLRLDSAPRVEARVKNDGIKDVNNIELVAAIFDSKDNAIAASRTYVEKVRRGETTNIYFTWPKPFDLGEIACEKPSSVILAIDRSGSMSSLGTNPIEPLTSVKNAASYFVSELKETDYAGVIPFATEAEKSPEFSLTNNFQALQSYIQNINILSEGIQYTNIADALSKSLEALSLDKNEQSQKVLVLLTDGVATKPSNPKGSKSEKDEITFAENVARDASNIVKQAGVTIYTIGLGKDIHQDFLREIASAQQNFYEAPSTTTLTSIYKDISSSICKELPSRIEITYKILDTNVEAN